MRINILYRLHSYTSVQTFEPNSILQGPFYDLLLKNLFVFVMDFAKFFLNWYHI